MALTFTATRQGERQRVGTEAMGHFRVTCAGTTSDNGDTLSPSTFGMAALRHVILSSNAVDSASNPENAFVLGLVEPTTGTFKVTFHSQATAGATTPLAAITDGTSVANYVFHVTVFGTE